MRTNENMITNEATKVCVMRCFYDEEGEYREEYMENIEVSDLPEKAAVRVDLGYDINVLYSKWDVFVVARSISEINEYKKLQATPKAIHGLLHCEMWRSYDGYMSIVSNFRTLRKRYNKRSKKAD